MTAIRTIEYTASPSGVKPIAPQDAGVRGEHKATNVVFNLDASLIKPEYKYRFEYVDGFSGLDTTEFVQPVGSTVSILLPVEWTAGGGCGTLRLCIAALDSQSNEEQTIYTFPASLLFAERETGGECDYKKGLSALIDSAGKATDAANEAAESANAAADRVDEAVSSANAATVNANRAAASADASAATAMSAAGTATTAAGAANTAASQAQAAKAAADTAASGANAAAEQARTAAANANTAAGTANTAASNANAVADAVQAKLDAGELKGEKGDTGPEGPQGVSGVYVGGGDMPAGYTVQVDPTGDMMCYTAGESDDRYGGVLTGAASGAVAALEDVSPTGALRRAAVLGATTETGTGDKGPDNPYALTGVQSTSLTVCGKNLLDLSALTAGDCTKNESGSVVSNIDNWYYCCLSAYQPYTSFFMQHKGETFTFSCKKSAGGNQQTSVVIYGEKANGTSQEKTNYGGTTVTFTIAEDFTSISRIEFRFNRAGERFTDTTTVFSDFQLEKGDTATPYEPYTGQTITLPALAPLYGDGTVNDEYDAATGVETRRCGILTPDGTGATYNANNGDAYFNFPASPYSMPGNTWGQSDKGISTHVPFSFAPANTARAYFASSGKRLYVFLGPEHADIDSVEKLQAWLSAQVAAGTPFEVVYPLAEPVITRHDPTRILPPAPVCRVFADAGTVAVGYNRDVNIVIPKLEAALAELLGGGAEPMT